MNARQIGCIATVAVVTALLVVSGGDPRLGRTVFLAALCLALWLFELFPPFVPTMVLLVGTPLLLQEYGPQYEFRRVIGWAADPVLVLFFGGFLLGLTAQRHGLDTRLARLVVVWSAGSSRRLIAFTLLATAGLSMWMSNVAAAAVMLAALRPIAMASRGTFFSPRPVLLAVAVGANLGGIASPIGTGPNALAIAAVSPVYAITFLGWMAFAVPLTVGMLLAAYVILVWRYRVRARFETSAWTPAALTGRGYAAFGVILAGIAGWLLEPVHGISAPVVALTLSIVIFVSGLLESKDLSSIDWPTLGLIAGGITLGRLLEAGGALAAGEALFETMHASRTAQIAALVIASAVMSAVMSNTATAALLIPLASTIDPTPSTSVIVAIAASFGMPFVISTPPNAMIHGEGGVTASDLLWVGLPLMVLGCAVLLTSGPAVLDWVGMR